MSELLSAGIKLYMWDIYKNVDVNEPWGKNPVTWNGLCGGYILQLDSRTCRDEAETFPFTFKEEKDQRE